jgi:hypothetical protein
VDAAAFAPKSAEALVAAGGLLTVIRRLPEGPAYRTLTAYTDAPVAVAFSTDSSRAIMATATGDIRIFETGGSELPAMSCGCNTTGLHPLAGGSLFRLNDVSAGPLWLLDAGSNPRFWFVPPEVAE